MEQYICVYDFETDGKNPNECQPVQLAACMLSPTTLNVVEDSEFCTWMQPEREKKETWDEYYKRVKDTITWHARNYYSNFDQVGEEEQEECRQKVFENWKSAPSQKTSWKDFTTYLLKYNSKQRQRTKFGAPFRAGANIRKFDNIIVNRMCKLYGGCSKDGEQKIFNPRVSIDILDLCFLWFENMREPHSYAMDNLRVFFGMETEGSHDALKDIRDEAIIIKKFLKLHRHFAPKVSFRNAMAQKV